MGKCDGCGRIKETRGSVLSGQFGQFCAECRYKSSRQADARSAQYARDRDREAHEASLVQPWDRKGNPNPEFIRLYPEESKGNFTQEEIEKFG